jgi:uncharacterized protein (TIGR03086 family)
MMTAKELYLYALGEATKVVQEVDSEQMEFPTPDTDWSVYDLLQHITYELAWAADIVAGKTVAEVGDKYEGVLFNSDLIGVWEHYEPITRAAVEACDESGTAHLSYADKTIGEYLLEAGNDQLVHAWDLSEAVSVPVVFDEVVAQQLYEHAVGRQEEFTGSGLFASPVAVSDTADTLTKLLALLGRSKNWRQ